MSSIKIWRVLAFLKFYFKAKTLYNIHSPYLYDLLTKISEIDKQYYNLVQIEVIRTRLLHDHTVLNINDLGAGTSYNSQSKSVADICKKSSSGTNKCMLLYNLAKYFQPSKILELGTNLGLATAYLQYGAPKSTLTTVEGDVNLREYSQLTFNKLGLDIRSVNSSFEKFFKSNNHELDEYSLCYIDGNHTYADTVKAYNLLKPQSNKEKVLIFDDIYWSRDMGKAWNEIKNSTESCFTIDVFQFGIVIFSDKIQQSEHIKYIPWKYKPFSTGLMG